MNPINNIFVVGAGQMGHGIAFVSALNGYNVQLFDMSSDALALAEEKMSTHLQKGLDKGKVSTEQADAFTNNLRTTTSIDDCTSADLFIEAIPEKMSLKKELFKDVDKRLAEQAIIASNTSSLSIHELALSTSRADRFVGLHFFNPVHIMKLLEIIRGPRTSDDTYNRVLAYGEAINKSCITVNDAPGFATSRLGITLGNEAMRMVEQGVASAADIDQAMKLGYGHPMGPLMLTDWVGLDVRLGISNYLYDELSTDTFRPPRILRKMVEAGMLGRKSGRGFYIWENGKAISPNLELPK